MRLAPVVLALAVGFGCGGDSKPSADSGPAPICEPGATRDCYGGREETRDVGACKGGTETCSDDGLEWSPCIGQVTPVDEVCANDVDEDCDGMVDFVEDVDGDGFTRCQGDCCETSEDCAFPADSHPDSVEVYAQAGEAAEDEDCDAEIDEFTACDDALAIDDADAEDAARSLGICKASTGAGDWGLVSAVYTRADGDGDAQANQHGITDVFGTNLDPAEGSRALILSTGVARDSNDEGACGTPSCPASGSGVAPAGFPADPTDCEISSTITDDIALELTLLAPPNAGGYSFDYAFYSFDHGTECSANNDQFVILVDPAPAFATSGNIAFGTSSIPISVNTDFIRVCDSGCSLGNDELMGTGFDSWGDGGATSWLRTSAPVTGGEEVTIRLTLWDTGDQTLDSTVVIDNFRWLSGPVSLGTEAL